MTKFIKTKRSFSWLRKYGFLFTFLVAFGGLFQPKLGLLVVAIMLGLIVSSIFNAKFWCGNVCPHGSYFDNIIMPFSRNTATPRFFKSKALKYGFFIFFAFNISRKLLLISKFWNTFSYWDRLGTIFATTYLMVLIVGGLLGLVFSPRTWCQICPMGTMEKVSYSLGKSLGVSRKLEKKVTISQAELCKSCGLCHKVCPMQIDVNNSFDENNQISDIDCIKCSTCIVNCPMKILSMKKASN